MADEFGFDSISLGNVIGFAMEASEKGLIAEKIGWGQFEETKVLINDIAYRRGFGSVLAEGVRAASKVVGHGSSEWAMHVKGLEVSAYDCHAAPAMALAYGTSSIGAHHKDAWVITWEMKAGRESYDPKKVDFLIETQLIRGGIFEALTVCRFPYNSLGLELGWYQKYLKVATGVEFSIQQLNEISERMLNLIRAFWVREYKEKWSRELDVPPLRWFRDPLREGTLKGKALDLEKYNEMLTAYYEKRGWDMRGVPKQSTLQGLGLSQEAEELDCYVKLEKENEQAVNMTSQNKPFP
jgi:aldehyde:ferredoxin oxidoreductase